MTGNVYQFSYWKRRFSHRPGPALEKEVKLLAPSTKLALANSLKKLLQKKFLDDITVKEIVEDCEVNRQTFYYHFQDIYDLLRWYLSHETEQALTDDRD